MHDGEDVERAQSPAGPDFDRCEVCGEDGIPVSLQERGPCCCPLTVGCWLNAMCLQDVGHCGIGDVISDVLKCSLNAIVAPRRILSGEANDGIHDFLTDAWSTRLAFVAGVELFRDQSAMPSQNRVWRDDVGQFQESFASDGVSLYGKQSTLVVIEDQSFLSKLLKQSLDLSVLELDDLLLSLFDEAAEGSEQNVLGLEQEGHVRRRDSSVSAAHMGDQAAEMRDFGEP